MSLSIIPEFKTAKMAAIPEFKTAKMAAIPEFVIFRNAKGCVINNLWFYRELRGKSLRVFSPRCGVFVTQGAQRLRKGRKGFASFAKGARLQVLRA
jgi:hypothetical protein